MKQKEKRQKRIRRHKRVRAIIKGTSERPRLSVFRSSKHIYAQLIDDTKGATLLSVSNNREVRSKKELRKKETIAFEVGKILAEKAVGKGIKKIVFDRGGYKYHGRVKALAEGVRKGGLRF